MLVFSFFRLRVGYARNPPVSAGNHEHPVLDALMTVLEIVVVIGRMLGEHDHADAGRFGGGQNLFDRAAAVVREGGMHVQQRDRTSSKPLFSSTGTALLS